MTTHPMGEEAGGGGRGATLSDAMVEADDDVVPVDLLAVLGLEQGAAVPHLQPRN